MTCACVCPSDTTPRGALCVSCGAGRVVNPATCTCTCTCPAGSRESRPSGLCICTATGAPPCGSRCCPAGTACDPATDTCRFLDTPIGNPCGIDADCSPGQISEDGVCVQVTVGPPGADRR